MNKNEMALEMYKVFDKATQAYNEIAENPSLFEANLFGDILLKYRKAPERIGGKDRSLGFYIAYNEEGVEPFKEAPLTLEEIQQYCVAYSLNPT